MDFHDNVKTLKNQSIIFVQPRHLVKQPDAITINPSGLANLPYVNISRSGEAISSALSLGECIPDRNITIHIIVLVSLR